MGDIDGGLPCDLVHAHDDSISTGFQLRIAALEECLFFKRFRNQIEIEIKRFMEFEQYEGPARLEICEHARLSTGPFV